jgi:hypothetical protein
LADDVIKMDRPVLPSPAVDHSSLDGGGPAPKRRQRGSKRYGRLNSFVGFFLVALVIASAIPVGSNRPAWWLVWTMCLGILGMFYVIRTQILMGTKRAFQVSQFGIFIGLAGLVPIYAVLQSLPIATWLPAGLVALPHHLPASILPSSISVMPEASLLGAVRALGFLVFLILAIEVGTRSERNHHFAIWLMIGIFLHAIFGLFALTVLDDYSLWGTKTQYQGVLTGTFVNRNSIATFLGFGLVLATALALDRGYRASLLPQDRGHVVLLTPARLEIFALWMAVGIFSIAIVLTQSRMGTFASAIGAYVTFVAMSVVTKAGLRKVIKQTLIGLLVLLVFLIPSAGERLLERGLFTLVESDLRGVMYAQTWGMIMDRPWTGMGFDAFAPAFELYRAPPLVDEQYLDLAHNTYLALWAEQGFIVGSVPILLAAWAVLMIAARLRDGQGDLALNTAALGVAALGALHSTADFSLEMPANAFCFVLILGLAMARPRISAQAPSGDGI